MNNKTYIFLLLFLLIAEVVHSQAIIEWDKAPSDGGDYTACESVALLPGFNFKASINNSLRLQVNPETCDPYGGLTIHVTFPGNLAAQIGNEKTTVTDLTLTGTINDADFATIKQMGALKTLDMSGAIAGNKKIPSYAFQNKNLNILILPSGVETIEQGAFQTFKGSVVLQEGLKNIAYQGFLQVKLTEILIFPNSLETIGDFAFGGADIPKGIKFGKGLKRLGRCTFDQMKLPFMDFSNSQDLEEIGAATFRGVSLTTNNALDLSQCNKLSRAIQYGGSVSSDYAGFSGFSGHVVLSDELQVIPTYLFYKFPGTVTLPQHLKTIKNIAFRYSTIKEIDLPSELLNIEEKAFESCTSLQKITSRSILPANLGTSVFDGVNKTTCQLIIANESVRLYKNADQWKDFLNVQGTDELNQSGGSNNSDEYLKGKEGSVHIWISNGKGNTYDEGGLCFAAYDFDKQTPISSGFQGTYKTIEIGEYEYTNQNLRAKYQNTPDDSSYERLNWTDSNIAGITKMYSNESPLSVEEFGKFYGNWFNFYHNVGSYGFDYQMKFRDKEDGTEIPGWTLPDLDDMAQLIGLTPLVSGDIRADVLRFLGASKDDAPVGHEADWFNKAKNVSGLTLTPLGSREPIPGSMEEGAEKFKTLSRLRLKGRGRIFNFTLGNDFGFNGNSYLYMQVRYTRPKTDDELGYKLYVDSCNNAVVMLPYDQKTRLTELPKGLERGIALRYANKSEMKIYKSWTSICYEADWIRTQIPNLPTRPTLKYTCVDLNKPEDFEKGKEGSVHIWISNGQGNNVDEGGICFAAYDFDKQTPISSGFQGTYKTIEIGEYVYTSQNLRAKYKNAPDDNSYERLNWTNENIAGITKMYSNESPLSVEEFSKFYGNWFNFYHNVGSYGFDSQMKFRDKEGGQELPGWGLPEARDFAQLIGLAPRVSGDLRADVLRFVGASKEDAPVGHEADWFNKAKNISGLTLTPLGSREPIPGSMEEGAEKFKTLSRLRLKGRGQIFNFTLGNDFGFNGNSYLYMQVRYAKPKTDEELGYKLFVDLEKDSVVITPTTQDCDKNFRELAKGLERGIALRYSNFEANKVLKSWSEIKQEALVVRSTMRDLPVEDPLLPCIPKVLVTGVAINKSRLNLNIGESETLVATVLPADALNKDITWTSSDDAVASVSSTGVVTAITNGVATITVTTNDGNKTASCKVTVDKENIPTEDPVSPNIPNIPQLPEDNESPEVTDDDYKILFSYNKLGDRTERNVIVLNTRASGQNNPNDFFMDKVLDHEVRIYPNPTKGQLIVEISDMVSGNIKIINLQGKMVSSQVISNYKTNLDISSQPAGIYVMSILVNGKVSSWKIIKE